MPKVPNMKWGVLMNWNLSDAEVKQLIKIMPSDYRWHYMIQHGNELNFDGKIIRNRSAQSMT